MHVEADSSWSLLEGETIVWSGRPTRGLVFSSNDIVLIPFSLLWTGIAFTNAAKAAQGTGSLTSQPVLLLFVVLGLYFVVGRFIVDAWLRSNTRYALTNQRILIARSAPFGAFTALSLDRLPETHFIPKADGRGTLRFGQSAGRWGRGGFGTWSSALDPTPQFIAIEDAQLVFDEIQRAARSVG
jgi:hypothetical protein